MKFKYSRDHGVNSSEDPHWPSGQRVCFPDFKSALDLERIHSTSRVQLGRHLVQK
jgi:hypothetical protein